MWRGLGGWGSSDETILRSYFLCTKPRKSQRKWLPESVISAEMFPVESRIRILIFPLWVKRSLMWAQTECYRETPRSPEWCFPFMVKWKSLVEASLLLGAGSDLSVHNNWIQSAVPIYWGRMKKNKNKVFFSQKNMKQKEKLFLRTNLLLLLHLVKTMPLINLACNLLVRNWVSIMERWEWESTKIKELPLLSKVLENKTTRQTVSNTFVFVASI